jgi:hypothetical protein
MRRDDGKGSANNKAPLCHFRGTSEMITCHEACGYCRLCVDKDSLTSSQETIEGGTWPGGGTCSTIHGTNIITSVVDVVLSSRRLASQIDYDSSIPNCADENH